MNILITGIHGFVGSNLVERFSFENTIYGLDIVSPQKEGVVRTYSWKDLEQGKIPKGIDAIIHLAGKAHDTRNQSKAQIYFDINTGLTQKIYDYFLDSSAKKFIFFSSVKAAADKVEGDVLTENVVPSPKGPYGESKIKAEEYIKSKWSAEKSIYILRPCMIHGPGNKGNLNLLYNVVSKGIPWPLGAFENKRSFTSIDNLCYILEGLLTKDVVSGIYHIVDYEAVSTNEIIQIICQSMGRKASIWKLNKNMMEIFAELGSVLHLPFNMERLSKLTENYIVSNVKIKEALEITYLPVKAKDGLIRTIKSFQKK